MMPPDTMHELGQSMATALASAIKENPNDNVAVHRALWDRQRARIAELEALLSRADEVIIWELHMPDGQEFQKEVERVLGIGSKQS